MPRGGSVSCERGTPVAGAVLTRRARLQALAGSIDGWTKELAQCKSASDRIQMDLEALAKDEAETRENLKVPQSRQSARPCLNHDRVLDSCFLTLQPST